MVPSEEKKRRQEAEDEGQKCEVLGRLRWRGTSSARQEGRRRRTSLRDALRALVFGSRGAPEQARRGGRGREPVAMGRGMEGRQGRSRDEIPLPSRRAFEDPTTDPPAGEREGEITTPDNAVRSPQPREPEGVQTSGLPYTKPQLYKRPHKDQPAERAGREGRPRPHSIPQQARGLACEAQTSSHPPGK